MTILVILALPCTTEIVRNLNLPLLEPATNLVLLGRKCVCLTGLFFAGVHHPVQERWHALHQWGASCGTVSPCAFVPSTATRHVDPSRQRQRCSKQLLLWRLPSFSPFFFFLPLRPLHLCYLRPTPPPLLWSFLSWCPLSDKNVSPIANKEAKGVCHDRPDDRLPHRGCGGCKLTMTAILQ